MNSIDILTSKTPKVYKNKKLNNANYSSFSHNEYQVFLYLIGKIGGVNEFGRYLQLDQLSRKYTLTAKEFSDMFNVALSNSYSILKSSVDKLITKHITLEQLEDDTKVKINLFSMAKYNKKEGNITVEFTDRIMPYLSQVNKRFTLYNLKEIANFGSLYTTRLYELIQDFKETGWMHKSIVELREVFGVNNQLQIYNNFKRKTFAHACNEINHNYDLGLRFEEIKEGRKVVAVKFFFKPFIPKQVTNQITGEVTTIYEKPKQKNISTKKTRKPKTKSDILDIVQTEMIF